MRVTEAAEPAYDRSHHYHEASPFEARWVAHPAAPISADVDQVFVAEYVLSVRVETPIRVRVHVSADERYVLRLNEQTLGRGPERRDQNHWHFETYDLELAAGTHRLSATVHSLGRNRPYAQVSVRHAFLLMAEGEHAERFSTGLAPWQAEHIDAYAALPRQLPSGFVAVGARVRIDGAALSSPRQAFPVVTVSPVCLASMRMESPGRWQLAPAALPPMLHQPVTPGVVRDLTGPASAAEWSQLIREGTPLTVPVHSTANVLIDLGDYYCAYFQLATHGGRAGVVRIELAEALFADNGVAKRNRDQTDGLRFIGMGDECHCSGAATVFEPLWWLAGRYVRVAVTTADEPLTLTQFRLDETRYPTTWDTTLDADNPQINAWLPITRRAMEMCSHETYYDCPYYEQLMYVGDARLEALISHAFSRDDRLPRKAVRLFDQSRTPDGFTQARYPAKTTQVIPPFSFWWVAMVHDLAMWRDRPDEVARRMPGVRAVMGAGYAALNADGLYQPTTGWNFVDWVPGWAGGVPPGGAERPVAPIHFQFAYVAALAAELEDMVGEPQLAARHRVHHQRLIAAGRHAFFDSGRMLFADAPGSTHFSEHAQSMAMLAGAIHDPRELSGFGDALTTAPDLSRATIYYTHYLFETFRLLGRAGAMFDRMTFWSALAASGFKTTPEQPEPSRSDCHAWGAHPMFHLVASVLGVRPSSPGFKTVHIRPQLGPLTAIRGQIIHPRGIIDVTARRTGDRTVADVRLPDGVTGVLTLDGQSDAIG